MEGKSIYSKNLFLLPSFCQSHQIGNTQRLEIFRFECGAQIQHSSLTFSNKFLKRRHFLSAHVHSVNFDRSTSIIWQERITFSIYVLVAGPPRGAGVAHLILICGHRHSCVAFLQVLRFPPAFQKRVWRRVDRTPEIVPRGAIVNASGRLSARAPWLAGTWTLLTSQHSRKNRLTFHEKSCCLLSSSSCHLPTRFSHFPPILGADITALAFPRLFSVRPPEAKVPLVTRCHTCIQKKKKNIHSQLPQCPASTPNKSDVHLPTKKKVEQQPSPAGRLIQQSYHWDEHRFDKMTDEKEENTSPKCCIKKKSVCSFKRLTW